MLKLLALGALGYAGYKYYTGRDTASKFDGRAVPAGDPYNVDASNPSTPADIPVPAN